MTGRIEYLIANVDHDFTVEFLMVPFSIANTHAAR